MNPKDLSFIAKMKAKLKAGRIISSTDISRLFDIIDKLMKEVNK